MIWLTLARANCSLALHCSHSDWPLTATWRHAQCLATACAIMRNDKASFIKRRLQTLQRTVAVDPYTSPHSDWPTKAQRHVQPLNFQSTFSHVGNNPLMLTMWRTASSSKQPRSPGCYALNNKMLYCFNLRCSSVRARNPPLCYKGRR